MSSIVWLRDKDAVFVKAKILKDYTGNSSRRRSVAAILSKDPNAFGIVSRLDCLSTEIEVKKEDVFRFNITHENPAPDLASINDLNEAALLNVLRRRFLENEIYTKIEPLIISVNPYKRIPYLYDFDHFHALPYEQREAHIYCIAKNALQRVSGINQSIAVSGESGAGKTEACKLLISYLTKAAASVHQNLSNFTGSTLDVKILACNPILEAFGNASTLCNDNSSRFGKYLRLRVQHGSICGAELIHYLLEKGRVIDQHPEERTFHVFYQLFAGAGPSMLSSLHLDPNKTYQYLGAQNIRTKTKPNDADDFFDLIKALSDIGMGLKTQNDIFKLIAAILHLGNFQFKYLDTTNGRGNASCELLSTPQVNYVSEVLGIPLEPLKSALTSRTIQGSGRASFYSVPLSVEQAKGNTAALAKELYNRLFSWLVNSCNKTMTASRGADSRCHYIGILDIFGFEVFEVNRFEQLCINFCNEKIQAMFNTHIFEAEIKRLVQEGIPVDGIKYESCTDSISLLEGDNGIFKLIDEFCFLNKSTNEDLSLLELMDKMHNNINPRYFARSSRYATKLGIGEDCFLIKHFAGDAIYSVSGFIAANGDRLENDLSDVIGSSNSTLIQNFYTNYAVTRSTEHEEKLSGVSTSRKEKKVSKKVTISAKFRENLKTLITELESTDMQFLRCIKPNQTKTPGEFDAPLVYSQLCYSGVVGVVAIRKCSFPLRQTWSEIHDRLMSLKLYKGISEISLSGEHSWTPIQREAAAKRLFELAFEPNSGDYYSGKSKVYMKQDIFEKIALFFSTKSVICIQQRWRGVLTRQKIIKLRDAVIAMQRLWWEKKYRQKKLQSIILCQAFFRMCLAIRILNALRRIREVSYLLHRWKTRARIRKRCKVTIIRLFLLRPTWRLPISRLPPAHRKLSSWFRAKLQRIKFLKSRAAVTKITAWFRGRRAYFVFRVEIKQLREILRDRLERHSCHRLIAFLRVACFRNYCKVLFANVKGGHAKAVKLLLRRIRKPIVPSAVASVNLIATEASVSKHATNGTPITPVSGMLKRSLTRSNSIFDAGSAMPFHNLMFMPTVDESGQAFPSEAINAGIRFGRSAIFRDVNINEIRDSTEGFGGLLHTAANLGYADIVSLLIECGANPMLTDSLKFTPLHRTMRLGKVGFSTVEVLLGHAKDLAGARDIFGRTARDIAEEKSSIVDSAEISILNALMRSENVYKSHMELAERKKKQKESASKKVSIDQFMKQLAENREKIKNEELSNGYGEGIQKDDTYFLVSNEKLDDENIGRHRSSSAPPLHRAPSNKVRRSTLSVLKNENYVEGYHNPSENSVYQQTKKVKRGSMNAIEISNAKKASLAKFIQATMKKQHKKSRGAEEKAQVSPSDLILKKAFLDIWENSKLLRNDKSLSLQEYLIENKDLNIAVTVPQFKSVLDKKPLTNSKPYSPVPPSRKPFDPAVKFSPQLNARVSSPLAQNIMSPLIRPPDLSIVIPSSPNSPSNVESTKKDKQISPETRYTKIDSAAQSVHIEKFPQRRAFINPGNETSNMTPRPMHSSELFPSHLKVLDFPDQLSPTRPTAPKKHDNVEEKSDIMESSSMRHIVSSVPFGSLKNTTVLESKHPASDCSKREGAYGEAKSIPSQARSSHEASTIDLSIAATKKAISTTLTETNMSSNETNYQNFWENWNAYVNAAGDKTNQKSVLPNRKSSLNASSVSPATISPPAELRGNKRELNKLTMQTDAEYQRLIAKRKMAEKDPILSLFQTNTTGGANASKSSFLKHTSTATRSAPLGLTGIAASKGQSVLTSSAVTPEKAKVLAEKSVLPPRKSMYPPGVPGKRLY